MPISTAIRERRSVASIVDSDPLAEFRSGKNQQSRRWSTKQATTPGKERDNREDLDGPPLVPEVHIDGEDEDGLLNARTDRAVEVAATSTV